MFAALASRSETALGRRQRLVKIASLDDQTNLGKLRHNVQTDIVDVW